MITKGQACTIHMEQRLGRNMFRSHKALFPKTPSQKRLRFERCKHILFYSEPSLEWAQPPSLASKHTPPRVTSLRTAKEHWSHTGYRKCMCSHNPTCKSVHTMPACMHQAIPAPGCRIALWLTCKSKSGILVVGESSRRV